MVQATRRTASTARPPATPALATTVPSRRRPARVPSVHVEVRPACTADHCGRSRGSCRVTCFGDIGHTGHHAPPLHTCNRRRAGARRAGRMRHPGRSLGVHASGRVADRLGHDDGGSRAVRAGVGAGCAADRVARPRVVEGRSRDRPRGRRDVRPRGRPSAGRPPPRRPPVRHRRGRFVVGDDGGARGRGVRRDRRGCASSAPARQWSGPTAPDRCSIAARATTPRRPGCSRSARRPRGTVSSSSSSATRPTPACAAPTAPCMPEDCWGATPGATTYQQLYRRANCPGPDDEWLPRFGDVYSHAAVIGANLDPVSGDAPGEPPYAAAIFLHRHNYAGGNSPRPTSGCVSLAAPDLVTALTHARPGARRRTSRSANGPGSLHLGVAAQSGETHSVRSSPMPSIVDIDHVAWLRGSAAGCGRRRRRRACR